MYGTLYFLCNKRARTVTKNTIYIQLQRYNDLLFEFWTNGKYSIIGMKQKSSNSIWDNIHNYHNIITSHNAIMKYFR